MGKKKKIARYPNKFGKKFGTHPIVKARSSNPVVAVVETVVEAVEAAVEAVAEAVMPPSEVKAPKASPLHQSQQRRVPPKSQGRARPRVLKDLLLTIYSYRRTVSWHYQL